MLKATGHVFINGVLFILLLWVLNDYIRQIRSREESIVSAFYFWD